MTTAIRFLGLALAIALTAVIVWAFTAADFWASFGRIIADPWGVVSLVDLYFGFAISCVLIFAIERGRPLVWPLIIAVFILGNVITALWLAWRAADVMRLVRRQAD